MRKWFTYIVMAVTGLALTVFLFANRQPVFISMDPTSVRDPAFAIGPMPLWVALAGTLAIGLLLGGFGMWLSFGSLRHKARARKREIKRLEHELKLAGGVPQRTSGRAIAVRA